MQIHVTLDVPDSLASQAQDIEQTIKLFADQTVQEALKHEASSTPAQEKPSKWARIVERNKRNPMSLGDYTEQDRKHRREFRENFEFNHDKA